MLLPHDAAVVERDRALPGLGLLLDTDRFLETMRRLLPERQLAGGEATYLRYKPGTSCVAGFRLHMAEGPAEVYAKAYAAEHYAEVRQRREKPGLRTTTGATRHLLDEHAVVVRGFPHDRELKALSRLTDQNRRSRMLLELLPDEPELARAALTTLRYKPERRYVGLLSIEGRPCAVLKVYEPRDFNGARLGAAVGAAAGGPAVLGFLQARGLLLARWLLGEPLCRPAPDLALAEADLGRIGAALARLHASEAMHPWHRTRDHEANGAFAAAEALAVLCPRQGARARTLALRVITDLVGMPPPPPRLIHGDFSADQVVFDRTGVHLIDWDNAASGDPAADLGSFLARLEVDAIAGPLAHGTAVAEAEAFCAGYDRAAGALPQGIELQAALGLLRLVPEGFRTRAPDWPARTAAMLDRAEQIYRRCHRHAGRGMPALRPMGTA